MFPPELNLICKAHPINITQYVHFSSQSKDQVYFFMPELIEYTAVVKMAR